MSGYMLEMTCLVFLIVSTDWSPYTLTLHRRFNTRIADSWHYLCCYRVKLKSPRILLRFHQVESTKRVEQSVTWCHSVGGGRSSRRSTAARGHSRRRQSWSPGSWSWADSSSLQSENISLYHLLSRTTTMNSSCHTWKLYVYILLTGLFQLPPDLTTILLQQAHVSSHWFRNISLYESLDLFRSQINMYMPAAWGYS